MFKLLLLALIVGICQNEAMQNTSPRPDEAEKDPHDFETRIVGGNVAPRNAYPHQVSLQIFRLFKGWTHFCSGSIIGENKIVTAAHCLSKIKMKKWKIRVVAGAHNIGEKEPGQQIHRIRRINIHPLFTSTTADYDFAVFYTTRPFQMSPSVKAILPASQRPLGSVPCTASGWGLTNSGQISRELRHVPLTIQDDAICKAKFQLAGANITDQMICAQGMNGGGVCFGDSGGPLTCRGSLVGIASWIFGTCGNSNYPGIFANVSSVFDWIQNS